MSDINSVINVSITRNTTTPTQLGFGIPLIMSSDPELNPIAGKEWGAERVRSYASLTSVAADFPTTSNVYNMASAVLGQNPSPPEVKIGRRSSSLTQQEIDFVVDANVVANEVVGFQLDGVDYTVVATAGDPNATATSLAGLTPPSGVTWSSATDTLSITVTTPGDIRRFGVPRGGAATTTTAGSSGVGLVQDFQAVINQDNDFYGVILDANSETEILALGAEILANQATNPKQLFAQTFDDAVKTVPDGTDDPLTGSVAAQLKGENNERVVLCFTESGDYFCAAWPGLVLPEDAGTVNWAYQTLSGISPDSYTDTELGRLEDKNVNTYTTLAGVNAARYGSTAGGEWTDVMRGSDWLTARIRERVLALLLNANKVPYTDPGIALVRAEILAQLQNGVTRGFLAADPEPTCDVPLAADVSAADKANRHLRDVRFRATLAGAVNKTTIVGELNL